MDESEEFTDAIAELTEILEELRGTLETRGPLGMPRPPTPGELFRFTERYTIPAIIATLEAAIRSLELLAAAIRIADGRPLEGDRDDRIATTSRRSLAALDDALAELQRTVEGGEPPTPELRRLLARARTLRSEIDDRIAEATDDGLDGTDHRRGDADESDDENVTQIDVEAELDTIKREIDGDDAENTDGDDENDTGDERE